MRDVIVVGCGGGGAVIAKELAERGLDVLLLEGGPRFDRLSRDWTHFEVDANHPFTGFLRAGPARRSAPASVRDLPQNSVLLQVAGVGGTTTHYFGNSPRAMPGVFAGYRGADRALYDSHVFPFPYEELVPYYEWVEHTLPVQTAAMGLKEEIFFGAASRLGLPVQTGKDIARAAFRPQENAILQPTGQAGRTDDPRLLVFPASKGCTFCGHCFQGCYMPLGAPVNHTAKRSTTVSYVPMALTADGWRRGGKAATLIADAFVTRVEVDRAGRARGVTWRSGDGEPATEEARVVVLAAGAVETPRLWLNSGLPNPNDQVGRGLTDHFQDLVLGVMPFDSGLSEGPASGARADFPGRGCLSNVGSPPAIAAQVATLSDAGMAGLYDNGLPGGAHGADTVGRLVGRELKALLSQLDRLMAVAVFTDDDVEAQNRVTLSALPPDAHGPVPRIEMRHRQRSDRTLANREFLASKAVELMRAAGALRVHRLRWPPVLIHLHSTMRMGVRPEDSMLDAEGESRFIRRVFIADNSALANSLGGTNPTLTTQALATRTAEKLYQRYFAGEPWVRRESPVSSTDAQVTRAVVERGL
jgi:choline dehydrogenase-like flavoprotein